MRKQIITWTIVLLSALALMMGGISVSAAEYAEMDNVSAAAEQMAYDEYGDYYDDYQTPPPSSARPRPVNWFKIIGGAFLVSVLATGITVFVIYGGYKFNGRTEPYPYNRKAPLELTDSEDVLIDTDVQRERIHRD